MENIPRSILKLYNNIEVAYLKAKLSYAKRLKVGAIITTPDNRTICEGRNGLPAQCKDRTICENVLEDGSLETKEELIHAEANAICYAAKKGIPLEGCILYITDSPCFHCAKLVLQAGIKEVYYDREYRIKDGIDFLNKNGCKCINVNSFEGIKKLKENNLL
nr:MAG TPA: deoxycytidylate deaminase [Caudoviricetes sp.]